MSDKKSTQGAGSPPPSGASKATPPAGTAEAAAAPADTSPGAEAAAPGTSPESAAAGPGLPDLEAHAEAPAWLSGEEDHDGSLWDGAFQAESAGAAASGDGDADAAADAASESAAEYAAAADAAEPLLTDPDSVTLETPSLAKADISAEAAEAASLDDAAAEVKAVEAEAADASVLTDPAANSPAARNRTEGIAAAAPMTDEDRSPAAGDAREGLEEPPAAAGSGPDGGAAPAASGAAEPTPSRRSRRTSESAAPPEGNGRNKRLLLILGILGVLAVLVILLFTVLGNTANEPGVLDKDVAPVELQAGACLKDFSGINEPATVVTCETPHNAQLVATANYPDSNEFPGDDALSARATEICSEVRYSEALAERGDLALQENKVIPTPASWNDGDRRIDCFVVAGADQELAESLLEQQ